jgi:hypothetical protein
MQNKPNFPHFSPENEDFAEKQSQFKANSKRFTCRNPYGKRTGSSTVNTLFRAPVQCSIIWPATFTESPATAILDRFLHHAEIVTITGRSYRLKDRAGNGGTKKDKVQKDEDNNNNARSKSKPS